MKVGDVHIIMKFQQENGFGARARDGHSRHAVSSRKGHPGKVKQAAPSAITAMAWPGRNELTSFGPSFLICRMRALPALMLCGHAFFQSNRENAATEDPLMPIVPGGISCVRHYSKCFTCTNSGHHLEGRYRCTYNKETGAHRAYTICPRSQRWKGTKPKCYTDRCS